MPCLFQLFLVVMMTSCAAPNAESQSPKPAHHTEGGFQNLHIANNAKGLGDVLKWQWAREKENWTPERVAEIPQVAVDHAQLKRAPAHGQLTWLGHATVLFQAGNKTVITDPVFSDRASPVGFAGPKRFTPAAMTIDELPSIDVAIVSHNHYDHLDRESVKAIGDRVHWVAPLGHRDWFEALGITRFTELDWWETAEVEGIRVTATPAQHWSARGVFDRFECLWASWLVEIDTTKFWFGGDTGYNPHQFKEIGQRFGPIDWAAIPIGAYAPRWFMKDMHVNPAEAAKIFLDIQAKQAIGIHWGTFQLTDEAPMAPAKALGEALSAENIPPEQFQAIPLGKTL